jgi:hypothetical protein
MTRRARRLAVAAAVAGVVVAVGLPPRPTLGPEFTAQRGRVLQAADSMLRARGVDPAGWTRLTTIGQDTLEVWPEFLRQHRIVSEAQRFASSYVPPTWWIVRYVHTVGNAAERTEEWRVRLWPDGRPLDARHVVPDSAKRGPADSSGVRRIAAAALARERVETSTLRETEFGETARPARRDVRVTYTDTAVKLPAGAVARVWVDIAGDEPLVVRRGVELPEAFLRADRAHRTNQMAIAGVSILLLFVLVITGAIAVKRRLPVAVHDGAPDRRTSLLLIGGLFLLATLSDLNSLPSQLYSYDTAQPWSTFVGTTALGFVGTVVLTLMLVGLWLVLGALRRRVGIPMVAGGPPRSTRTDMLIAGLGLGGIIYATTGLDAFPPGGMPPTPSTALNDVVPVLAGIADIPAAAIAGVAMVGIPILVVAGLSPRWSRRALIAAAIGTLVAAIAWSFTPAGDVDPARVTLLIASVVVTLVAIKVWGARSAWSWIVAALSYQALGGLRDTVYGPESHARGAGALTVLVATALIALIVRRATSAPPTGIRRV